VLLIFFSYYEFKLKGSEMMDKMKELCASHITDGDEGQYVDKIAVLREHAVMEGNTELLSLLVVIDMETSKLYKDRDKSTSSKNKV